MADFCGFSKLWRKQVGYSAAPSWDFSPQIGVAAFPIEPRAVLP
jgi:hypothetical protein